MTTSHTPTPWSAVKAHGGITDILDVNGHDIFTLYASQQANAAHIVKCVNMHDELVAVVKTAFEMIDDPVHWSVASPKAGRFDEDKLKELLKKAGAL